MEADSSKARIAPWLGWALCALAACGPAGAGSAAAPSAAALPAYSAAEAALFDDTFSPDFFGLERPVAPDRDTRLRARVQVADTVFPARVATVTRDSSGDRAGFSLELQPTGPALRGRDVTQRVVLSVGPTSPSFAWIESVGTDLVGTRLILLAKRYNDGGVVSLHWHGEPDSPPVRQAIDRARLLSEVRK